MSPRAAGQRGSDSMANNGPPEVVPGVFSSREQAEAAIAELRQLGLRDEDLGLAVPDPGRYQLLTDTVKEAFKGMTTGIAIGAPLGSLAGLGLMSIVLPGVGLVGLGGLLVGVHGGAVWGAVLGGMGGLLAKVRWDADEDRWCEIPLGGGDILVVARAGTHASEARKIMERHGARCFLDQVRPERREAPPAEASG